MVQRRLTIDLPRSPEALHNVLQMLLQYGLISEQKARNIEHEETSREPKKKSRWAQAAEEMSEQGYLRGIFIFLQKSSKPLKGTDTLSSKSRSNNSSALI